MPQNQGDKTQKRNQAGKLPGENQTDQTIIAPPPMTPLYPSTLPPLDPLPTAAPRTVYQPRPDYPVPQPSWPTDETPRFLQIERRHDLLMQDMVEDLGNIPTRMAQIVEWMDPQITTKMVQAGRQVRTHFGINNPLGEYWNLDGSGSMSGKKIEQVNSGMSNHQAYVQARPQAADKAVIAAILVGPGTRENFGLVRYIEATPFAKWNVKPIEAHGGTQYAEAAMELFLMWLEFALTWAKLDDVDRTTPGYFWKISDGRINDYSQYYPAVISLYQEAQVAHPQFGLPRMNVFPVAVGNDGNKYRDLLAPFNAQKRVLSVDDMNVDAIFQAASEVVDVGSRIATGQRAKAQLPDTVHVLDLSGE